MTKARGKNFMLFGIFLAASSVMLGAFGAHGLKGQIEVASLESYKTGINYQMIHALALILFSSMSSLMSSRLGQMGAWTFVIGTLFFSGSIYLLTTRTLTGIGFTSILGPMTPIGGMLLIVGWLLFFIAVLKNK